MSIEVIYLCVAIYVIAFIITVVVVPLSIQLAHRIGAIDVPKDNRRVHTKPIPRIGGIAIFTGVNVTGLLMAFTGLLDHTNFDRVKGLASMEWGFNCTDYSRISPTLGILLGGCLIFLIGFIDDLKGMKPKIKLAGQILAASLAFYMGVQINFVNFFLGGITHFSSAACYIVTVLWIVAITNTINLVDGLDGLASGVTAIASLCIAYVGYIFGFYMGALPMMIIAGAAMGFLLFNFYPAKTFMGDCGSQYLGYLVACFSVVGSVKSATVVAVLIPGLALSLPIFDTAFAIVRRIINKKPVMEADKGHLHHRLLKSGLGQRRTVLCIYGVCGIMGIAAVLLSRGLVVETVGLAFVALMYIYVVLTDLNNVIPKIKEKGSLKNQGKSEEKAD